MILTCLDLKLNYYALIVAIFNDCLPETAFEKLQCDQSGRAKAKLSPEDHLDMKKMKEQGLSLREIGRIYGIDSSVVCRCIKRAGKKEG